MRTKIILVGGLGLMAFVSGHRKLEEYSHAANEAAAATAEVRMKLASLESAVRRQQERLAAAEKIRLTLQREVESAAQPKPDLVMPLATKPVATELSIEAQLSRRQQERLRDPKVQLARLAVERAGLATRYDPLYRSLGLAPEQRSKFEEIVAKHDEDDRDLEAAVEAQGFTSQESGFGNLYAPLRAKLDDVRDAAQRTLLGEEGFRRWQEYERTEDVRTVVAEMTGAVSALGVSLTGQQAEKLVGVMAQASKSYQDGHGASTLNVDWALFDRKAREVLSEAQLTAFRNVEPQGGHGGRYWAAVCVILHKSLETDAEEAAAKTTVGKTGG
jgi:hypothetical protein